MSLVLIFIVAILVTCSTVDKSKLLIFKSELPYFVEYNFLTFTDQNGKEYYILSNAWNEDSISSNKLEKLEINKSYRLNLVEMEKGKILKTITRKPVSFYADDDTMITKEDTLVGTVYTSPDLYDHFIIKNR